MLDETFLKCIQYFFPRSRILDEGFGETYLGEFIARRLQELGAKPLSLTEFNQITHLMHEGGVSEGYFSYYFLTSPDAHPYPVNRITAKVPALNSHGISSLEQLDWGLRRTVVDALLYFGNIRGAYNALRKKSIQELDQFFQKKRFSTEMMLGRGSIVPFKKIPADNRHLIGEIAAKGYIAKAGSPSLMEQELLAAYKANGGGPVSINKLVELDNDPEKRRKDSQGVLDFLDQEVIDSVIENEEQAVESIKKAVQKFHAAQTIAKENTKLYLSLVNELDVYVATSMRTRGDFRQMARDCEHIFSKQPLKKLHLRYFDPTMSAADIPEDKGLIECLMVKCARALLYFAGEKDSYGKDAEVAMAMSLGRPAIILCPSDVAGEKRMKFFRDIHPLSRLIHFGSGVASGAMVTNDRDIAASLLERIFTNAMEYDIDHSGDGYFRLRERLTKSVVRLQTNNADVRETFWNYYHYDRDGV